MAKKRCQAFNTAAGFFARFSFSEGGGSHCCTSISGVDRLPRMIGDVCEPYRLAELRDSTWLSFRQFPAKIDRSRCPFVFVTGMFDGMNF